MTNRGRISPIPAMAHALKFDTWPRPVISDHPDPQHVAEQADTYFGALVLASLLAMRGLQQRDGSSSISPLQAPQ